jgi:hypothetical protein
MSWYKNESTTPNDVVVDLSNLIEPLMNYQDISDLLSEEQENRIVDYVRAILKMSHSRISRRYQHWQEADRAHDVWVPPDATKFREKAVIADTRAISDTVLTYMMAALTGRNPMFQLEGLDRKSRKVSAILERLLHQQMRRTAGEARIAQLTLDSIRYGFAPTKIVWSPKDNTNHIINFDPRRVFPDPRVSWGDWEKMQYICFVDYQSTNQILASGLYPKFQKYPALRRNRKVARNHSWEAHEWAREEGKGLSINPQDPHESTGNYRFSLDSARVLDEAWIRMSGYEIGVPSIDQIWLIVAIIDEQVCLRFQLNPYGRQFPTVLGGLFFDKHKTFSQSLYDLLLPLHDIATWLLRSRIDNVQAALSNLIFVDPTQVSIPDLIDRNPWGVVRTLPGTKPGDGVYIANVPDVTKGHWNDIAQMHELKQRLSAASDAQQGMPTVDGVRTATEIQRLSQMGSQRLGVLARVMSATTMRPLVRMMLSNIQDALEYSGAIRMDKADTPGLLADVVKDGYIDFNVNDLQGNIDYLIVDGTLPVEPTRSPETWMNILQILNQSGLQMEYKAGKMVEEAIRAMGLSDLDQFKISEEERKQGMTPSQQLSLMEKMRGANVMPQEQLSREVEKGNLIPMRQAA